MANYNPYLLDEYYDGTAVPPPPTTPFQNPTVMQTGGPLPPEPYIGPMTGGPLPPDPYVAPTQFMQTGGNLPPTPVTSPILGGNTPPIQTTTMQTGGNLPPTQVSPWVAPQLGGNTPPVPVTTPQTGGNTPPIPVQGQVPGGNFLPLPPSTPFQSPDPALAGKSVQDNLASLLDKDSPYMRNARRSGMELASSRGLLNSNIAAGTAERAAIESAMPILAQTMGLQGTREGYQFTGQQNQFNRELQQNLQREQNAFHGEQAGLNRNHDFNMAQVKDWMDTKQFTREFYGTLSMMPIKSTTDLMTQLQTYAIENPEVYTPEIMNGMGQFFSQNMMQLLAQYWPSVYGQQQAAPPSGGA